MNHRLRQIALMGLRAALALVLGLGVVLFIGEVASVVEADQVILLRDLYVDNESTAEILEVDGSSPKRVIAQTQITTAATASSVPKADGSGIIAYGWLEVMTGDGGSGGNKGAVPAPGAGDATNCLLGDATWGACGGGGQQVGWAAGGDGVTVAKGDTDYLSIHNPAGGTTRTDFEYRITRDGVMTNFAVNIAEDSTGCATSTVTVMDGATPTALSLTISGAGWTSVDTDTPALVAGDLVSIEVANCGTGGGTKNLVLGAVSMEYQ